MPRSRFNEEQVIGILKEHRRGRNQGERRLEGFNGRILSLYAWHGGAGDPVHLEEHYGVSVSSDLTSQVTDAVLGEVREWQNEPLDSVHLVVFFDALRNQDPRRGLSTEYGGVPRSGDHL